MTRARRASIPILMFALVALCAGLPSPAHALRGYDRGGWLLGLGYGMGRGSSTQEDGQTNTWSGGASPQIRFGKFLSPKWMLSLEWSDWLYETGPTGQEFVDEPLKFRRSQQFAGLGITFYPGNPSNAWGGLYFRAGAGSGWARTAKVELEFDEEKDEFVQVHETNHDEWGKGFFLSTGYDFQLTGDFAAGLSYSYYYINPDGTFVQDGWWAPLVMELTWSW